MAVFRIEKTRDYTVILQVCGVRSFFSDKYDITTPRYKYLTDADKKNTFDVERYMKRKSPYHRSKCTSTVKK